MLGPLFHAWERHLASVSKDRVVRPFEWGTEWIPMPIDAGDAGPVVPATTAPPRVSRISPQGQPDERSVITDWVEAVMTDSRAFFHAGVAQDYQFDAAGPERSRTGEAGTLRFTSAMRTPHPENNTVVARWFPADDERSLTRSGPRGRAVVVMAQWNSDAGGHVGLSQLLARFGVSALRISLPYHDARMPPELTRADYIVSANIVRTLQVCRQAVLDIRRAVAWLASLGFERIGLLGTSLGSCLAMLTSAHEPRVRAQALNHVSPYFGDVVWRGLSTRHVRAGLEGSIDVDTLRALWRPISPFSYLEQVRTVKTLLVYAKYDLTFPLDLSRLLIDEFARRGLPHEAAVLWCGHYSTGLVPFKYIDGYLLTRFLRRAL